MTHPARFDFPRGLLGPGLALAWVMVLLSTMDIGFGRDEGYYFRAGELYSRWFAALVDPDEEALSVDAVERHFKYNPEHPAIYKSLFGLSWRLLGDTDRGVERGALEREAASWYAGRRRPAPLMAVVRESTAFRLPTVVTAGLLLWLLYVFGAQAWDRRVGVAAALLFAAMPRAFYHSHLAAFDLPVTFWNLLVVWLFWRSVQDDSEGRWRPALLCGVAWGVALGVKLNAFFTPIPLLVWWLIRKGPRRIWPLPKALWAMAGVGPILLFALWPRLWAAPIERLSWYLGRHWEHEYYWAYYFGQLLDGPPFPWLFPLVMTAVTLPATTLLLTVVGGAAGARAKHGATSLIALSAAVPILLIAFPSVPVFGGTKHWLPAMPFLALFAGVGVARLCDALPRLPAWAVIAAFVVPPAYATAHAHPDSVAYYNELFGGFAGAGEQGMQREFWGSTAGNVLPWVNDLPEQAPKVHWHDTNHTSFRMYQRDGRLRADAKFWRGKNAEGADWYLFHWHKEFLDDLADVQVKLDGAVPHAVYARDGLPLLTIWGRR